jgi:hypothetical protein
MRTKSSQQNEVERIAREVHHLNGTLVIDKKEFIKLAKRCLVKEPLLRGEAPYGLSLVYAAANTAVAQSSFVVPIHGVPVTCTTSGSYYFTTQRHIDAKKHRASLPFNEYGASGGRGNKKPRE